MAEARGHDWEHEGPCDAGIRALKISKSCHILAEPVSQRKGRLRVDPFTQSKCSSTRIPGRLMTRAGRAPRTGGERFCERRRSRLVNGRLDRRGIDRYVEGVWDGVFHWAGSRP